MKRFWYFRLHLGSLTEQLDRPAEQVVEVHAVAAGEGALILDEDAMHDLVVVAVRLGGKALRPEELRLRGADPGEDGAGRIALGVEVHDGHRLLDEGHLVVVVHDDELAGDADGLAVAPQDHGAEAVERSGGDGIGLPLVQQWSCGVAPTRMKEAVAHLSRGAVSEGYGGDASGSDADAEDEVGDAVRDDACLAGARPRDDEQGAVNAFDSLALCRVESIE